MLLALNNRALVFWYSSVIKELKFHEKPSASCNLTKTANFVIKWFLENQLKCQNEFANSVDPDEVAHNELTLFTL